jgi:hypothetical protein
MSRLGEMQSEPSSTSSEPKRETKTAEETKLTAKDLEKSKPSPKLKQDQDIHRVLWERTRFRSLEIVLVQGVIWMNLFGFARGTFTGARAVIPFVISIVLITHVLTSVTKFGSMLDIAVMLLCGFSSLLATFSTLYWNYGIAGNFTERLTRLDAIYFSVGTLSTAGTGNISAVSQVARGLQTMQMILDVGFVVFAVSLAIAAISSRMQKK